MRLPIQVLVYPIRQTGDDWEYLLLHRVGGRGAFWQGVTGAPFEGETLEQAARRELLEETQITPVWLEPINYEYSLLVSPEWAHLYALDVDTIREYVFAAQVSSAEPVLSHEHDAHRWCSFEQALSLLHWPNNKDALEYCREFLAGRSLQGSS